MPLGSTRFVEMEMSSVAFKDGNLLGQLGPLKPGIEKEGVKRVEGVRTKEELAMAKWRVSEPPFFNSTNNQNYYDNSPNAGYSLICLT